MGNPELVDALRLGSSQAINASLRRDFRVGAHTALALREKTERFRVSLLGELDDEVLQLAGLERASSIGGWLKNVDANARGALAPRGAGALYSLAGDAPGL